jgi:hypothetical protein
MNTVYIFITHMMCHYVCLDPLIKVVDSASANKYNNMTLYHRYMRVVLTCIKLAIYRIKNWSFFICGDYFGYCAAEINFFRLDWRTNIVRP